MSQAKIAYLFPGQASQYVGMGRDLYEQSPLVRELYEQASVLLGFDVARFSFEGPSETLKQTIHTQPAILVHSVAVVSLLAQAGMRPAVVAGHSLGEYSALVAVESLGFSEAVRLVRLRSQLMHEAGVKQPGTMAAIIGLDADTLEQVCRDATHANEPVQPANFNSPEQIAIAGAVPAVQRAMELAKTAGAKRAIPLEVSGAFHSVLMKSAQDGLSIAIADTPLHDAAAPVIANVTASPVTAARKIRQLLVEQLTHPVRWVDSMRAMTALDVEIFIETGPGTVLKGLMRRINPDAVVLHTDTLEQIHTVIETFQQQEETDATA